MALSDIKKVLHLWLSGNIARNAAGNLFWQASRIAILTLWTIIFSRYLGADALGVYSGIAGLATTIGCLVGFGQSFVLYQDVSTQPSLFETLWHRAVSITLFSSFGFLLLYFVIGNFIFEEADITILLLLGISELMAYPLVTAASCALSSKHETSLAAALVASVGFFRLLSLVVFINLDLQPLLSVYLYFHAMVSMLAAIGCIYFVQRRYALHRLRLDVSGVKVTEGLKFSGTWTLTSMLGALDKTLVLYFSNSTIAGLYSAVHRFIYAFAQPIDAIVAASVPKMFGLEKKDIASQPLIRRLVLVVGTYALVACLSLMVLTHALEFLLGHEFHEAHEVLGWSGVILICYGFRSIFSYVLFTSKKVEKKLVLDIVGALSMLTLGACLIPAFQLKGAVFMLIGTELILLVLSTAFASTLLFSRE